MKKLLITITLFSSFLAISQEIETAEDEISFEKAVTHAYREENEKALESFTSFLNQYPDSFLKPRAKFNIGIVLRKLGRNDEAISVFSEILNSDYNEKESYGGIMEQYALYKNRSAKELAEMYFEKKEYKKASDYVYLFDKKYKYLHFCGNEMRADDIYIATSYAKLFLAQNKPEKAIRKLLPYLFDDGLASNSKALDVLEESLKMKYSTEEIKALVNTAVKTLKIKNEDEAQITFLGKKLTFFDFQLYSPRNPNRNANLELTGQEKFEAVLASHTLFSKYL